jgi:hypothetical protein
VRFNNKKHMRINVNAHGIIAALGFLTAFISEDICLNGYQAGGWDVCGRLVRSIFISNWCMKRLRTLNPAHFCFLSFLQLIVDRTFQCNWVFSLCQVQCYRPLCLLSPHLTERCQYHKYAFL